MALLDRDRDAIVLRIVYDGPAAAGKTTSVRSLGASLGRPTSTPEEAGERTLYFDWLDYTGGLFEGRPLRCQIVTVPGQAILARRRRALIATADAIVYVSAVSPENLASTLSALQELADGPEHAQGDRVGVVLQANKRDLPTALPLLDLRAALDGIGLPIGIVESTATSGAGIREAFVFSVRLALDRVREQLRAGTLASARPAIDSADELYRQMRNEEIGRWSGSLVGSVPPPTSEREGPTIGLAELLSIRDHVIEERENGRTPASGAPAPPDERVPSGMIWPPIDGRILIREATIDRSDVSRVETGWSGENAGGWRLHSPTHDAFAEAEDGRSALVHCARLHAQLARVLSSPRCVALAEDGSGGWRLWQVMRARPSLRGRLTAILDETDADHVAASLIDATSRLVELHERLGDTTTRVPVTLDTVGVFDGRTQYVGFVVEDGISAHASIDALVDVEMGPIVSDWSRRSDDVARALGQARFRTRGDRERAVIGRLLVLFEERTRSD